MSCGGWTRGSNPASSSTSRRQTLAYRRYLRFLPGYGSRGRNPEDEDLPLENTFDLGDDIMGLRKMDVPFLDEATTPTAHIEDGMTSPRGSLDRVAVMQLERALLRNRGLNQWLRDQEERRVSEQMDEMSAINVDNESRDEAHRKDVIDKVTDVSVSARVRQYTAMLQARNNSEPNVLQTSRSCSSLHPYRIRLFKGHSKPNGQFEALKNSRQGSLDSGDGDMLENPHGPRFRSFSLPWPSEVSWRWSSPNIMDGTQSTVVCDTKSALTIHPHSSSLARLDSGNSDEGCPRDGSTGPTPPLSPVFRVLNTNHLSGLITPFRALSPASSMGSHLGSVEDIPLLRSQSLGNVGHWIRSRSADSAVVVEDDSALISPTVSPAVSVAVTPGVSPLASPTVSLAHQMINGGQEKMCESEIRDHRECVDVCATGVSVEDSNISSDYACICDENSKLPNDWCDNEACQLNDLDSEKLLPNGEVTCEEIGSSHVFSECEETPPPVEDTVELRHKVVETPCIERRERRCGEVDGDVLLRRAGGLGGLAGTGVLKELRDESCRKVFRTPSVVISDHSGDTISLTVALASSDFSIDKLDDKFQPSVSPSSSSASLCVGDDASRKVSSCSSCSSVSTVDLTTPLTPMLVPNLSSLIEVPQRRISDCSLSSNMTISEDEIEQVLPRPPPPKK
ncbi:hypothetical protein SK128_023381, partial [Halocaridina rubra]